MTDAEDDGIDGELASDVGVVFEGDHLADEGEGVHRHVLQRYNQSGSCGPAGERERERERGERGRGERNDVKEV